MDNNLEKKLEDKIEVKDKNSLEKIPLVLLLQFAGYVMFFSIFLNSCEISRDVSSLNSNYRNLNKKYSQICENQKILDLKYSKIEELLISSKDKKKEVPSEKLNRSNFLEYKVKCINY